MTWTKPADKLNVTLNRPSYSYENIFKNNLAEFQCVITGQDATAVKKATVTWTIDGRTVASTRELTESDRKKVYTLAARRPDWTMHSSVNCSVSGDNMETISRGLIVHKGDKKNPNVMVHILPVENINSQSVVSLVCLVSGTIKQDFYIAWSEDEGQQTGNYKEGTELLQEKDKDVYMVASVYTTTFENWGKKKFNCHVWPFGNNEAMRPVSVSSFMNNSVECRK